MFIFLAYPGSISDNEITKQSGYLDMMEPYTELMVDKGFNISNACAAKSLCCGSTRKTRIESDAAFRSHKNKTAKAWILKVFRFIGNEVLINMLSFTDSVL